MELGNLEQPESNSHRRSIGEIKSIAVLSEGVLHEDNCNIGGDGSPNVSKVYKSRNQMEQFYSNHKTTEPSEYLLTEKSLSSRSGIYQQSLGAKSYENIFSALDGMRRSNHLLVRNVNHTKWNTCFETVQSQVPKNLIADANRRQQLSERLSHKQPASGFLNRKKLTKK